MDDSHADPTEFTVAACNTSTASENRMHDDTVARTYGFAGGLVPGVVLLAYLAVAPAARWGLDWLARGSMSATFSKPVYDGEQMTVSCAPLRDQAVRVALGSDEEVPCASGLAELRSAHGPPRLDLLDAPPGPPHPRPPASPTSLAPGTRLAPHTEGFSAERSGAYLDRIGAPPSLFAEHGVAHPGWLVQFANTLLATNVVLGPWIHVSSAVDLRSPVTDGDDVTIHGTVREEYERRGHRFVVVDCLLMVDDRPIADIVHTAIHTPRRGGQEHHESVGG